ncbi:bifunctional diaminohydroxyphosphoribosylaminopyrimidine deaminase/5-amino-6-(5-phosphoribosylamino)uracil reductase RibD [Subtercola sp. YIM 133946]|uniref:bifunctional diaminohydroxyphosphoribosylaminopyrimidine deaminase/5-amino-6-(5-phosphoribosylamino)uracil reductase RibD n=1 Tax=Subtercola sp. YIM 133946 TaxID=3118909 RepID=UPI002F944EBA
MLGSDGAAARPVGAAMRRAIELSQRGPAWGVNPQVGCVLLAPDGRVLAEGWHRGAGTAHAEVDALSKVQNAGAAQGATAVVTLEPCNHTGLTGPCSEALIAAGVAEVVFAVDDPGARSAGGGARLAAAGVGVQRGLLRYEVEQSIRPWLTSMRTRRPYVTVKWAASLDGRTAAADGTSQWITGDAARADVHLRRSLNDAIMVATGTVLADDPSLTARAGDQSLYGHQPVPVVVGERGIAPGSRLAGHPQTALEYRTRDVEFVLADLFDRGMRSVFVEGGPTLARALLARGLADEIVAYVAPVLLGGPRLAIGDLGVTSMTDARRLDLVSADLLGTDLRLVLRPHAPTVTFPTSEGEPVVHRNH